MTVTKTETIEFAATCRLMNPIPLVVVSYHWWSTRGSFSQVEPKLLEEALHRLSKSSCM